MGQTWLEAWRDRIRGAWAVLMGRAWVGYGNPNDWQYVGPLVDDAADAAVYNVERQL
jgi:hypothetical protein